MHAGTLTMTTMIGQPNSRTSQLGVYYGNGGYHIGGGYHGMGRYGHGGAYHGSGGAYVGVAATDGP
jgi:hypothetical protein